VVQIKRRLTRDCEWDGWRAVLVLKLGAVIARLISSLQDEAQKEELISRNQQGFKVYRERPSANT